MQHVIKKLTIKKSRYNEENRKGSAAANAKKKQHSKCIILLGATKCGKSAFLRRLLYDDFSEKYMSTTEDYYEKSYLYKHCMLNLEFHDTGGPFEFPAMTDMHIRRADVAMVMYEVSNKESMQVASNIMSVISERRGNDNPLHIVLVGTKLDLYEGDDEGDIYSILDGYINAEPRWVENHQLTSSKNNSNIERVLELVLENSLLSTPDEDLVDQIDNENTSIFCCTFCPTKFLGPF